MKNKFHRVWFPGRKTICLLLVTFLAIGGVGLAGVKVTKSKSPAFFGLHGDATNGFDFASSRYGVIAPFAPTPNDEGTIPDSLDEMDNHFVYLFDTNKPKTDPIAADLRYCYYPSKVHFDEKRSVVLVRGVEYIDSGIGEARVGDILVSVGLNLEGDRKPYFDDVSIAPISIESPSYGFDQDTPGDFFLAYDENLVLLTNGEAIIAINRSEGYQYPVYFTGSRITYLDYNDSARLVTVGLSRTVELEDGSCGYASEVRFYELESSGVINLKARITEDRLPSGTGLMAGSKVIVSRSDVLDNKVQSFQAYFSTNDGSLWSVDFSNGSASGAESVTKLSKVGVIPELSESGCKKYPSHRSLVYDPVQHTLTIVKRGTTWRIMRPSLAVRPGKIMRPSLVEERDDAVVVIVYFDKKGNITNWKAFGDEFKGKGGLSNLLQGSNISYIATYDGDVFSLSSSTGGSSSPVLNRIGKLGPRVGYISKGDVDGALVGISSFELDSEGRYLRMGGLVLGKIQSSE